MQVRAIQPHELEYARKLLVGAGWDRQVATPEEFALLVTQSQLSLVAVREGEVVGFLRALTDGLTNGYISMVVVHPAYQRQGVGRALVLAAMGNNERMTWVLRAGRSDGLATFYEKLGFSRSTVAMERPGKVKPSASS
ncbi:GNAT family N-acetyltransferase [Rhizobacter sp. AJA081-3]|uniref:GNAT family N-acetyltransferase n=1 Tax=Rhizobacter sp. AJA081-3 TaxID=2753607 RepID=UPI001AE04718|nr:GNAT family N-acetyltransferase [Rhizobacter sp. AJA081-3]QTN21434.1 GNAT family N-acetyltransferase [Rhizobacter sp. AJA081-3]